MRRAAVQRGLAWALDRLGRSLLDLLDTLSELEAVGVALVLHQQAIDTATPAGRMFFQVTGAVLLRDVVHVVEAARERHGGQMNRSHLRGEHALGFVLRLDSLDRGEHEIQGPLIRLLALRSRVDPFDQATDRRNRRLWCRAPA